MDWSLLNLNVEDNNEIEEIEEMVEDKIANLLPDGGMCQGFDFINRYW